MLKKEHLKQLEEAQQRGWRAVLWLLLELFGWKKINPRRGVVASNETRDRRTQVLFGLFTELREAGYKVFPHHIRRKHVDFLVHRWVENGNKPATLQTKLSILRTFCKWIGKPGLVPPNPVLFADRPEVIRRSYATTRDRSPAAAGISDAELFALADQKDETFGRIVRAERILGLRRKEAVCFQPHQSDRGHYLQIFSHDGPKNGRERTVPVNTPLKRALVEDLKSAVRDQMAIGWYDGTPNGLKRSLNKANYLARTIGVTRAGLGFTQHDLRAASLTDELERDGVTPPVRGGQAPATQEEKAALKTAQARVMATAGHGRVEIGAAYYGLYGKKA